MKSLKALKQNNKGAGIVTVVVVLSFLTTIGLLIMAISYTSSEMRASERWGREVAYNANGVVEQMRSGAELAVSDSIKACYTHVMANYSAYRDTIEDEFDRQFCKSLNDWAPYIMKPDTNNPGALVKEYYTGKDETTGEWETEVKNDGPKPEWMLFRGQPDHYDPHYDPDDPGDRSYKPKYSVKALEAFVKAGFGGKATVSCLVDGEIDEDGEGVAEWKWKSGGESPAPGGDMPIGVVLKDVVVDYTRLMRTVRITTDIVIDFPDLGYVYNEETPSSKFTEFAVVALDSLKQDSGYVDVKGKAYAGEIDIAAKTTSHQFNLLPGGLLICNGNVEVNGNNNNPSNASEIDATLAAITDEDQRQAESLKAHSGFLVDTGSTIWTRNIDIMQDGIAALCYRANVLNDLNLAASGASALVTGEYYYGFGSSEDNPNESSAIISKGFKSDTNPNSTTLSLYDLNSMTLAGYAFVNTVTGLGVSTGQSMAVSEDQVAYLVPIEMLNYAVDETWVQKINTNPEVLSNDLNGVTAADKYEVILAQLNNKNNKPIQNTLWTIGGTAMKPDDYEITVKAVDVPYAGHVLAYFFMEFGDTKDNQGNVIKTAIENRNQFFRDYFTNNTDRVQNYLDQYLSFTDTNKYVGSVGNTFAKDSVADKTILRTLSSIINIDSIRSTVEKKFNAFANLCITLNEGFGPEHALEDDLGTDEEKETRSHATNPFNYYVKEDVVNAALDKMPSNNKTIEFHNAQGDLVAVVTGASNYIYNGTGSQINLCLIISTGNVSITSDFTGLIICKGQVTINPGSGKVTLTADSEAVNEAMGAATSGQYNRSYFGFDPIEGNDTNFIMPYEFLYYKYTPNQAEFDIDEGSYWDVGTLVYFDRWKKG